MPWIGGCLHARDPIRCPQRLVAGGRAPCSYCRASPVHASACMMCVHAEDQVKLQTPLLCMCTLQHAKPPSLERARLQNPIGHSPWSEPLRAGAAGQGGWAASAASAAVAGGGRGLQPRACYGGSTGARAASRSMFAVYAAISWRLCVPRLAAAASLICPCRFRPRQDSCDFFPLFSCRVM